VPAELYGVDSLDPRTQICPYRGLQFFREEDAAFYFGRECDLNRLVTAVDRNSVIAVIGASGSGKSSLVRAGLFPRIRQQTDTCLWQLVDMIPGSHPLRALARALLPLREPQRILTWSKGDIDDETDRLARRLKHHGATQLLQVIGEILEEEPGTTNLLILVDQWEEFYTYQQSGAASNQEDRAIFIRMLLDAVRSKILRVVLTLRADYWGEVLNDEPLAAHLKDDALVHLRALGRSALESVIHKPAEIVGLTVPDGLAEVLLKDAAGQPGNLALLEFTLQDLWSKADGSGTLMLNAYRAMGGLENAIVSHAERVYSELDPHERDAIPGVFAALVHVGEARSDVRRRARLSELSPAGKNVARRLADERLLVTNHDWTSDEDLLEVAHEALLRHWPRLDTWIEERRDALLTIRQLQADARNWLEKAQNPSYLWSHERVREAARAIVQLNPEVVLSDDEIAFLGPIDIEKMLIELERPETTYQRRALIGERLDVLGDTRPGVGLRADYVPDIRWCRIDGGNVQIGIRADLLDPNSPITDTLSHTLQPFSISQYAITVTQYRAFLDAEDGWCNKEWWPTISIVTLMAIVTTSAASAIIQRYM